MSDGELLSLSQEVERYRERFDALAALLPPMGELEKLRERKGELEAELQQLERQLHRHREEKEILGPARSLWHLFGSPPREVEAVQNQIEDTEAAMGRMQRQLEIVTGELDHWEPREKAYQRQIAPVRHLLQAREDLELEPVRVRLESIREQRQRQREIGREVNRLERWREVAQTIGQSDAYLARIEELKAAVKQGESLSDRAEQARAEDLSVYQEQLIGEPGILQEAKQLISGMRYLVVKHGVGPANGVRTFETKIWQIVREGGTLELRHRWDGSSVVRLEGKLLKQYRPTPSEREQLSEMVKEVERTRQQQQQTRPRGFSMGR